MVGQLPRIEILTGEIIDYTKLLSFFCCLSAGSFPVGSLLKRIIGC